MPLARQHNDLVMAARLYYLDDLSQGEIAGRLGVSRSSVSRMLADARQRGIVEIRIHPDGPLGQRPDLEKALLDAAGLQEVFVARRPANKRPVDAVAELAARIIEARLANLTSLGVSWGQTLAAVATATILEPIHRDIQIYPLVGGMPIMNTGPSGNEAIELLARKGDFGVHRFEAPAIVESEATWRALLSESSVQRAVHDAAHVKTAVVGIGSIGVHASPHVVQAMNLSAEEEAAFRAQRPVGDICGQFYDADGQVLGVPTAHRVIGITLDQLRAIPRVMGVAGGREKAAGVAGALKAGVLNLLVIDEELAVETLALLG